MPETTQFTVFAMITLRQLKLVFSQNNRYAREAGELELPTVGNLPVTIDNTT